MPLLSGWDNMGADGWEEVASYCNPGGLLALAKDLKKPIMFAFCAMFDANLPSSCGMAGKSCSDTSTL